MKPKSEQFRTNPRNDTYFVLHDPVNLALRYADIVDIMRRMRLLGFNAIRMPFSMQDLYYATPRDFEWQYCTNVDDAAFLASITNPTVPPPAGMTTSRHLHQAIQAFASAQGSPPRLVR